MTTRMYTTLGGFGMADIVTDPKADKLLDLKVQAALAALPGLVPTLLPETKVDIALKIGAEFARRVHLERYGE